MTAIGFSRSPLPEICIDGKRFDRVEHDKHTGWILPGLLWGGGVAFPRETIDAEFGCIEASVGLGKFSREIREVLLA